MCESIKISVNDKSIELTQEQFDFIKKYVVSDSLEFLAEGFNDLDCPIELFDENIVKYKGQFFQDVVNKLKEIF